MTDRILIVGCGFAGSVYARTLADAGYDVDMIDARPHIGGNCFDYIDPNGIRVHQYGPHLFHTNNKAVVDWLTRFGVWVHYDHRVRAILPDGRFVPLPVNLDTVNCVFGSALNDAEQMLAYLASIASPIADPRNAAEYLQSQIGTQLTDLFFRPYTKKMWAMDLEDMDASVVKRIPIRTDREDRYFPNDAFQMMPRDGYSKIFENILDHERIRITLKTSFSHGMENGYTHCFTSMPIDEYFQNSLGDLPYRSIKFHHRSEQITEDRTWSVTNFTDTGPYTRETWWHLIPHGLHRDTGYRTLTIEEPCDYRDNAQERYYPVKTADGRYQKLYQHYKQRADGLQTISFIGRCGTYQYLDMDQVINQSLIGVQKFLQKNAIAGPPVVSTTPY
jgi:UDP-galactopyranose mutase